MKKKVITLGLVAILILCFVVGCGGSSGNGGKGDNGDNGEKEAPKDQFVDIVTGGTAGTYFPLGGALAEIFNESIEGVNATSQAGGASIANINLLKEGKVELAFIQNDAAYYAEQGLEVFEDNKFDDIRGLATLFAETTQIVSLDSNLKTLADLKNKKVAIGSIGSINVANCRQMFDSIGLDIDKDIKSQFLTFADSSSSLKDGNVDASIIVAGIPTAAVQDVAAQHKISLVALTDETAEELIADYPFYTKAIVPANTYNGQTEDVVTLNVKAMLAVHKDLDEELVYNMLKALYENTDRMIATHPVGKFITKETALEGMSVPLHSGAERYYKEQGILK